MGQKTIDSDPIYSTKILQRGEIPTGTQLKISSINDDSDTAIHQVNVKVMLINDKMAQLIDQIDLYMNSVADKFLEIDTNAARAITDFLPGNSIPSISGPAGPSRENPFRNKL